MANLHGDLENFEAQGVIRPAAECPSRQSPIDLVHLARQTTGDRILESEVLGLLVRQIERVLPLLSTAMPEERRQLAHALKGAARNVGAFRVANAAERLEAAIADPQAVANLAEEMQHTARFARELAVA